MTAPELVLHDVTAGYGGKAVLRGVSAVFPAGRLSGVIGSADVGKTTLLRLFNRLVDLEPRVAMSGTVRIGDEDVQSIEPTALRRRVAMLFDKPTAFPSSIQDNVAFGLQLMGISATERELRIEEALRRSDLWDEVADRLDQSAGSLGPGARQRLCLARALALRPQVLLLDEPTLRLHPGEAARFEAVVSTLTPDLTVLLVTPDAATAGRMTDFVALLEGDGLVESGPTEQVFTNPARPETQAYLSRRFR